MLTREDKDKATVKAIRLLVGTLPADKRDALVKSLQPKKAKP